MDWERFASHYESDLIKDLVPFLSIPSVKTAPNDLAPFGKGIDRALQYYMSLAGNMGFQARTVDGYYGVVEYRSKHTEGDDSIGVYVHVDVVPPNDGWESDAFKPVIREGRIYGRGTVDNKGPAMAVLYALKLLKEQDVPLRKRIKIIVATDEENGWNCMKRYRNNGEELPAIGFAPDLQFPVVCGEKGQINLDLFMPTSAPSAGSSSARHLLLKFKAGAQINQVPDIAEATVRWDNTEVSSQHITEDFHRHLQMQNLTGTIRFNSDGICYIRIKGISAHSSEPQNGVNAGVRLASFLRQYAFQPKGELLLRWLTDHLGDPFGEGLRLDPIQDASGRLTVCPGKIYFDTDKSKISINIRTPVTILPVQIAKKICKLATEDGWEISDLRISPPHYVRPDHPVVRTLMNVFRERTGLEPAAIYSSGNTLANMMKFGVAFGPIFPGERNSSHEANESIAVSSLVQCVSIYAQALYELTGIDGEV